MTKYQVSSEDGNHVQQHESYAEAKSAARAMSSRLVQLVYLYEVRADEDDFEVVSAPSA